MTTPCNTITGAWETVTLSLTNQTGRIAAFRGLRYAAPPARFSRAIAPACTHTHITATANGPMCFQASLDQGEPREQSEDCLLANVFSPAESVQTAESPLKPVVLWIHGGSLTIGSNTLYGQVENFVLDGVVVVAINYRLGMLGFGALSAFREDGSGNFGFADQLQALRWVAKNIRAFGGDPDRVTVFGHSSGGTSVMALLASPAAKGLFSAALALSASPNITMPVEVIERVNERVWLPKVGCSNATDVLACMRALPARTAVMYPADNYEQSIPRSFPTDPKGGGTLGLAVVDRHTVTSPMPVVDVPVGIQVVLGEIAMNLQHDKDRMSSTEMLQFFERNFAPFKNSRGVTLGRELYLQWYPTQASIHPSCAYYSLGSDTSVTCGNAVVAGNTARSFSNPVYLSFMAGAPGHPVVTGNGDKLYQAAHGWDILVATGQWPLVAFYNASGYTPTAEDISMGQVMRAEWVRFFHTHTMSWPTVDSCDTPSCTVWGVVNHHNVTAVTNLKQGVCRKFEEHGIGRTFWWVN